MSVNLAKFGRFAGPACSRCNESITRINYDDPERHYAPDGLCFACHQVEDLVGRVPVERIHLDEFVYFEWRQAASPHADADGWLDVRIRPPKEGLGRMACEKCRSIVIGWSPPGDRHTSKTALRASGKMRHTRHLFGHRCLACGAQEPSAEAFPIDHLIPLAAWKRGEERFANSEANANLLCPRCNASKSALLPPHFLFERATMMTAQAVADAKSGEHRQFLLENREVVAGRYGLLLFMGDVELWKLA